QTLLPSYQAIMVFSFDGDLKIDSPKQSFILERCMVLGPVKKAFDYSLAPSASMLVINFRHDAFYRFFSRVLRNPPHPINPDELVPENCFTNLWTQIKDFNKIQDKIDYILKYCQPYLKEQHGILKQVESMDRAGSDPIKSISAASHQTPRHIQRLHKKQLGYSAKELARYQRFSEAVHLLQHASIDKEEIDWFDVINQCGYYDQSHLIRDFKHYMNLTPTQYLEFQDHLCNPVS
ncbi:MAG: helix-turn-helix domain-containing protein, partial [Mesonia hippocampi]|uniref:helix-turn-helix domain-containing protein n=1 Tax=Mesonia hippocampi TaxID=1628250 RepID=UPI003F9C70CD